MTLIDNICIRTVGVNKLEASLVAKAEMEYDEFQLKPGELDHVRRLLLRSVLMTVYGPVLKRLEALTYTLYERMKSAKSYERYQEIVYLIDEMHKVLEEIIKGEI